ncbi:MAG: HYR domain-containing protein [Candidatus Bipolaricaulota bacterium]
MRRNGLVVGLTLGWVIGLGVLVSALPGVGMSGQDAWNGQYALRVSCTNEAGYIGYDIYGKAGSFTDLGHFNVGEAEVVYLDAPACGGGNWTIRKFASADGVTWTTVGGTHTANVCKPSSMWDWSIVDCPSDVAVIATGGATDATASWAEPTVTATCCGSGIAATSQTHSPGDTFPLGTTVVTYTWVDVDGDTRTCSFNVAVSRSYEISASAGAHGSITPSGAVAVAEGGDATFVITADSGYHIEDVAVDGSSVGPVSSYTFADVDEDHQISATFAANDAEAPTVVIIVPADGAVYPAGTALAANWLAFDNAGLATTQATAPVGAAVDMRPGLHFFTVSATDAAGHSTTVTATYRVAYTLQPGLSAGAGGDAQETASYVEVPAGGGGEAGSGPLVRVAFRLTDATEQSIATAVADLTVVQVDVAADGGESYMVLLPVYLFAYDPDADAYIVEFSSDSLAPGIYDLWIGVEDGTTHVTRILL